MSVPVCVLTTEGLRIAKHRICLRKHFDVPIETEVQKCGVWPIKWRKSALTRIKSTE